MSSSLLDGLLAYWKLDEASGIRYDSSPNGFSLTDNNNTGIVAGKMGNAALFGTSGEYLSVDTVNDSRFLPANNSLTVAAWVKLSSLNDGGYGWAIIQRGTVFTNPDFHLNVMNMGAHKFALCVENPGNSGVESELYEQVDEWVFIVGWYDKAANTLNIQLNNGSVNTLSLTWTPVADSTNRPINIGGPDIEEFSGAIDELGIWNRVLTDGERTALYNAGAGAAYPFVQPVESVSILPATAAVTYAAPHIWDMGDAADYVLDADKIEIADGKARLTVVQNYTPGTDWIASDGHGWPKRNPVTIANSGSVLTDYQLPVIVQYAAGMNVDFSDLRFTVSDGITACPYCIVSKTDGVSASVLVKVPSIEASTTIYMYYGNAYAVSASNPSAVYDVWDDFSGESLDATRWEILAGNGSITQGDGRLNFSLTGSQDNDWWNTGRQVSALKLKALPVHDFEAVFKLGGYTAPDASVVGCGVLESDTSGYMFGRYREDAGPFNGYAIDKLGTPRIATNTATSTPAWLKVRKVGTGFSFWRSSDGAAWTQVGSNYSDITFNSLVLVAKEWGSNNLSASVDDFKMLQYTETAPSAEIGDIQGAVSAPSDNPSIVPIAAYSGSIPGFMAATGGTGSVRFQVSTDGGTGWLWWDGEAWSAADGYAQSNSYAEIARHIPALSATSITWTAFLHSDGTTTAELDSVSLPVQVIFDATVTGGDGASGVTWSTPDGGTFADGVFTAEAPGTYQVVATSVEDGTKSAAATITVYAPVSVSIAPETATIRLGATQQLAAEVTGGMGDTSVTWYAPDGGEVVDGLFTAPEAPGEYRVVATSTEDSTKSATATITVENPISVGITPETATLYVNSTRQFAATLENSTQGVTWAAVHGEVDEDGLYTAPAEPCEDTVTATSVEDESKSATASVTVEALPISVTVVPATATLKPRETMQLVASVANSTQGVTWAADGGLVSASGFYMAPPEAGTYTVTATSVEDGTKTDTCTVTVPAEETSMWEESHPDKLLTENSDNYPSIGIKVMAGAGVLPRGSVMGVVTSTGKYRRVNRAAVDGSRVPVGILAEDVDARLTDVVASMYVQGPFNKHALSFGGADTADIYQLKLRAQRIILKDSVR